MIRHKAIGLLIGIMGVTSTLGACSDDQPKSEALDKSTSTGGSGTDASGGAGGFAGADQTEESEATSHTSTSGTSANSTSSTTAAGSGGAAGANGCDPASEACTSGTPSECDDCGTANVGEACDSNRDCASGMCFNMLCGECMPGMLECNGSVPRQCSATGRWIRQTPCGDEAPYCLDGQCVGCVEGQTRPCADCSGLERCENHAWGACQAILPESCASAPDCDGSSCCESRLVEGGTFYFGPLLSYAETVTNYCLDRYEVTVGRFRAFLQAYDEWQPLPDAGEHLPGTGTGWQADWAKGSELPTDAAAFEQAISSCEYSSYTAAAAGGSSEARPQNCLTWFEAQAFCIWDGGRLATEAEWEYAAAGGDEERSYPWGDALPTVDTAAFDCCGDGDCDTCSAEDILPVGSKAAGDGRFGQADLAGNLYEWVLDGYAMIDFRPYPCVDCAVAPTGQTQVQRGGGYAGDTLSLQTVARPTAPATTRSDALGARCVRKR